MTKHPKFQSSLRALASIVIPFSANFTGIAAHAQSCTPLSPARLVPSWASSYVPHQEIYVSPNGNDANDGSSATKALKTANAAIKKLKAGVRLNFKAGTYACPSSFVVNVDGGTTAAAEIRSVDGPRAAKFNCGNTANAWNFQNVRGFIIDGIEIYGTTLAGIHIMSNAAPWYSGQISGEFVIKEAYIHNTGAASIKANQAENIFVIDSELAFVPNGHQNLEMVAVDNVTIAGNNAHDSEMFDEIKGGSTNGMIYRNYVHNGRAGILVGGDDTGTQYLVHTTANYEASNLKVWDNVIVNTTSTTDANNEAFRVIGCHNCVISNNSFLSNNPPTTMRILPDVMTRPNGTTIPIHNQNLTIVNNVFVSQTTFRNWVTSNDPSTETSGLIMHHNAWRAIGLTAPVTSIWSDIPITNETGSLYNTALGLTSSVTAPYNLQLKAGSPLIGKGTAESFVTNNYLGSCWPGSVPNIGAY